MSKINALTTVMELNRVYGQKEMECIVRLNTQDKLNTPQCLSCKDYLIGPIALNVRFCSQDCERDEAGEVMTPELPRNKFDRWVNIPRPGGYEVPPHYELNCDAPLVDENGSVQDEKDCRYPHCFCSASAPIGTSVDTGKATVYLRRVDYHQ